MLVAQLEVALHHLPPSSLTFAVSHCQWPKLEEQRVLVTLYIHEVNGNPSPSSHCKSTGHLGNGTTYCELFTNIQVYISFYVSREYLYIEN